MLCFVALVTAINLVISIALWQSIFPSFSNKRVEWALVAVFKMTVCVKTLQSPVQAYLLSVICHLLWTNPGTIVIREDRDRATKKFCRCQWLHNGWRLEGLKNDH
jgi:cation transporter-like permease